jgi:ketosteroid isomerase-like protein
MQTPTTGLRPDPAADAAATKAVACAFIERFDCNDIEGAVSLFADDLQYWLAGDPQHLPCAGVRGKAQMARLFERMMERLENGQRMRVLSAIAEGDIAALEVECDGLLKNGRRYRNQYHMRFHVQGGLIRALSEYYDTAHVQAVWFQP